MSLFLAFHVHAAKRGDGLLPEFLGIMPRPRDVPKAANEDPVRCEGPIGASKSDPQQRKTVRRPVIL
ncbi:hypothetical protein EN802_05015 [bacterium M00.F.Ca.ET.159.01.1.1]|nr:hypothetical protein EN873_25415 [bacterium M00.F.Ca.ET.230.01.1.1]TGQ01051.1 hypothetical protein EN864_03600 [bacterium M00.F.Ca.ET.221.01.1.1]TGT75602.1 hypothetical protein EN802_05015 [bacterium M00.F.Ca.ET.159.01.1.1]TGT81528.1 hypothetical protein EN800_21935 [bacterium M00.F.Ca.ET.157.01.1.1]TGU60053.1 hypothetical protein EN791_014960 [Mesorhizobium sp. M2D.F.Ca.ET.148.01.1.1]